MDCCCFGFPRQSWTLGGGGEGQCAVDGPSKAVLPLHVILRGMCQGTVMHKVRTPDRWYRRKYRVDLRQMRLSYSPSAKPFFVCGRKKQSTAVDLYELEEVREGWNSDVFNRLEARFRRQLQATFHPRMREMLREENCLSLVVSASGQHLVVDLVAPSRETRDAWVRGLRQLVACCDGERKKHQFDRWLMEQVQNADVNRNGSLNFSECLNLLNQLNISMSSRDAMNLFQASNFRKVKIAGEDALEPEEFVHFYHSLVRRPEIEDLMAKYSVNRSTIWSPEELQNFLQKEQRVICSLEECQTLIEKNQPSADKVEGYMSLQGFQNMLLSVDMDLFNRRHRIIYQDMTQPLNHYYIASSHNTYLVQDQLIGESSIEGYINALTAGCRCVELDTWDGGDGEPVIFHGYTLTGKVLFRDVLDAIRQYAFQASQYPVILSIENHCSVPQQQRMARHLVTVLGDYLHRDPVTEEETCFPSPESLARKILVKAKKPKEEESFFFLEEEEEREEGLRQALDQSDGPLQSPMAAPGRSKEVAEELASLVNYCSAQRFKSFEDCKENWRFNEMASFAEGFAAGLSGAEQRKMVAHNKRHLSRTYPRATRADSSNYDPHPHWNLGCPLVALNYQTRDEAMRIQEAWFSQNGKCGYLLKPKFLRDPQIDYDPGRSPHPGYQKHMTIKVISGQHLPKPNAALEGEVVDPYVSIKVTGHPRDQQKKKTQHVRNNGFNPVWNEIVRFVVCAPELALVHFRVKDQSTLAKNELLGRFSLPFTSIAEGYRHIHLQDGEGKPIVLASLFVHVQIESDPAT